MRPPLPKSDRSIVIGSVLVDFHISGFEYLTTSWLRTIDFFYLFPFFYSLSKII